MKNKNNLLVYALQDERLLQAFPLKEGDERGPDDFCLAISPDNSEVACFQLDFMKCIGKILPNKPASYYYRVENSSVYRWCLKTAKKQFAGIKGH